MTLGNITYHGVQASNVGIAIVSATPRQTNATGYVVAAVVIQNDRHDGITLDVKSFELVDSNGNMYPEIDDPSVNGEALAFDASDGQLKPAGAFYGQLNSGATKITAIAFVGPKNSSMNGVMLRFRDGMRGVSVALPLKVNSSVRPRPVKSGVTPTRPNSDGMSGSDGDQYRPSDQIFTPFELSKEIYRYKGQSGILDTLTIYMTDAGTPLGPEKWGHWPGGSLRLERMIDEHTAIYKILTLQDGGTAQDGEIAVLLPDSNPPEPLRFWRVLVEGVLEGTNYMGATIQIPAVRFEGYVEEPAQKLDAPKSSAPTSTNAVGGQRIFFVEPQYPPGAKIAHISGTVVLRATISKAGIVEKLQVVGSNPVFNNAALDAVKQWKFSPYLVNNEPTEFEKTLTVNFALNGGG